IIDAIAEQIPYRIFEEKVLALKPDLLVVETSTVTLNHDLSFLKKFSGLSKIVLCGPDVHISQDNFLNQHNHINFVLFGEYEATLLELAQCIQKEVALDNVEGLIYRKEDKILKNKIRSLIKDIDCLPWPLREQLPIKKYNDSPGDIPIPCASMWASRGCPFKCSFCLWPQVMYGGRNYRTRDVKNVVDEMEYLIKKLGFKSIYFDDDTWNIGRERMFVFCDELEARELNIPWAIMARAELMDEELLERMRKVGLFAVKYGIESSSQQLLDNIGKGLDLKKGEEVIKYTKYLGIRTHLTFTFGLPGETEQTIQDTIDYALKLNPTSVQFSMATPFPGTRFYEEMENKGYLLTKDLEKFDGNISSVIRTEHLSAKQLQKAKKMAYTAWDKHYQLKSKKLTPQNKPLRVKLKSSLVEQGIMLTLLKVLRYIIRRFIFFPARVKQIFTRKMWIIEEVIG
ncbi:MAG: radical SAM protein, partial [Candidatus Heimdallarchaeota archaeon]|nr:radical SAM protein [Candidatus Heimdallarchaeota archaeon]